jgi:hypothetical protein
MNATLLQKLLPNDEELNDFVATQTKQSQQTRLEVYLALCMYLALGAICAWKIICMLV